MAGGRDNGVVSIDLPGSPRSLLVVGALVALAACGGRRSSAPPPAAPTIVATDPADGATDVDPATVVTLTLAPGPALQADEVVVSDGGNRLPGTVAQVGTTTTWTWTPAFELPRGCHIDIATALQGTVASFTVRDIAAAATFDLFGEEVVAAFSWSNGRRAVRTASARVFELTPAGPVELFIDLPADARTFGDGGYIADRLDMGMRYCVRGNLGGTFDQVLTPLGFPIGEHNSNGDVVVFVPDVLLIAPPQRGLWRLMRNEVAFVMAGPLSVGPVADVPSIDPDGTVSLAYLTANGMRLSRFAPADLAGTHFDLAAGAGGSQPHFDCAADGRGVLAYTDYEPPQQTGGLGRIVVRAVRFDPASGFALLSAELRSWPTGLVTVPEQSPFQRVDSVVVGELGSACVVLAHGAAVLGISGWQTTTNHEEVRVEPDDRVAEVVPTITTNSVATTWGAESRSPMRAELWAIDALSVPGSLQLTRSRPDGVAESTIYEVTPGRDIGGWCFAFDDSNRAVVAAAEYVQGVLAGSRIVLVE